MAATAIVLAGWFTSVGLDGWASRSRIAAVLIVLAFLSGAALATRPMGSALL